MVYVQSRAFGYWDCLPRDPRYSTIRTGEQLEAAMRHLRAAPVRAIDTETSGLAWYQHSRMVGWVGAAEDPDVGVRSYYVPFRHLTGEDQIDERAALAAYAEVCGDGAHKVFHNRPFDDHIGRREGIQIRGPVHDTMVLARLYDENRMAPLKYRAVTDLGRTDAAEYAELLGRETLRLAKLYGLKKDEYTERFGYAQIPVEMGGAYGARDGDYTLSLFREYQRLGVVDYYSRSPRGPQCPGVYQTEMDLQEVLVDMEETGLWIDVQHLQTVKRYAGEYAGQVERELWGTVGEHNRIDLGNDDQLRWFLQNVLGVELWKRTKSGADLAVDAEVLEAIAEVHPAAKLVHWIRQARKIATTYTDSILSRLDDRCYLHGSYKQVGTATGRLSCENPNLTNMPQEDPDRALRLTGAPLGEGGWDPLSVRAAFPVPQGKVRQFSDWSQVELRVLAHYTQDPVLLGVYRNDEDVHERVALAVYGEHNKHTRRKAKVLNFGLCLVGETPVLTQQDGEVPLAKVKPWHLVWDGIEWVPHEGLICRGEQEVIEYEGLEGTPDHGCYTEDGYRVPLGCLASAIRPRQIAVGAVGGLPVGYVAFDRRGASWPEEPQVCSGCVWCLQKGALAPRGQREGEQEHELHMSVWQVQGSAGAHAWAALRRYGAAMQSGYARFLAQLQGAWHRSSFSFSGAFYPMGAQALAGYGFQGSGFRSEGQRWALRSAQPSSRIQGYQSRESACQNALQKRASVVGGEFVCAPSRATSLSGMHAGVRAGIPRPPTRRSLVYDLINAGPRHRYTAAGKVVSNSYGMGVGGYARQAKVSMERAEEDMGQFFQTYAAIPRFRDWLISFAIRNGCKVDNMFGRTYRVPHLRHEDERIAARGKRQLVASLIQGTAAEVSKEAMVRIHRWIHAEGLQDRVQFVQMIHDELALDMDLALVDYVAPRVKAFMEDWPEFSVPIKVDQEVSTTRWNAKEKLVLPFQKAT